MFELSCSRLSSAIRDIGKKKFERHGSKATLLRHQPMVNTFCGSMEVPILVDGLTVSWGERL